MQYHSQDTESEFLASGAYFVELFSFLCTKIFFFMLTSFIYTQLKVYLNRKSASGADRFHSVQSVSNHQPIALCSNILHLFLILLELHDAIPLSLDYININKVCCK